ncbi:MAG: hypothetical protein GC160_06430 [Acidobacteria bacterium]|nr:hypothetical protein [Acidobacteriota bacterium]
MHSVLRHFWDGLVGRERAASPEPEPEEARERRGSPRSDSSGDIFIQWATVDGEFETAPGLVLNVSNSGLLVTAGSAPEVGQGAWILRAQAPAIRGMVRRVEVADAAQSQVAKGSYLIALEVVRREKRRYERQPADGPARARWIGPAGTSESCDCRVRNLSDAGMQIEADRTIPDGSYVRVTGRQVECAGSMRYCKPLADGKGFLAGLQFVDRPVSRDRAALLFAETV